MTTILVVDDDITTLQILKGILETVGYQVILADDGFHVMDLLENNDVDLVITDIIMPKQEGLETILSIKNKFTDLPVIAMSSGGNSSKVVVDGYLGVAIEVGADKTIEKPINTEKLLQTVNELLGL